VNALYVARIFIKRPGVMDVGVSAAAKPAGTLSKLGDFADDGCITASDANERSESAKTARR